MNPRHPHPQYFSGQDPRRHGYYAEQQQWHGRPMTPNYPGPIPPSLQTQYEHPHFAPHPGNFSPHRFQAQFSPAPMRPSPPPGFGNHGHLPHTSYGNDRWGNRRDNRSDNRFHDRSRSHDRRSSPHGTDRGRQYKEQDARRYTDRESQSRDRKRSSRRRDEEEEDEEEGDQFEEQYSAEEVQEKLKSLQPAYVQCTQHSQYYARTTEDNSTVKALPLLTELHKKFETELSTRHAKLWQPTANTDGKDSCGKEDAKSADENPPLQTTLMERINSCKVEHKSLPKRKRLQAIAIVKKLENDAKEQSKALQEYIGETDLDLPEFALPKLKMKIKSAEDKEEGSYDTTDESENSDDGDKYSTENYLQRAGELINSIRRLKHSEKRLHDELWYNDPGQANDGPLCRCGAQAQKKGIRHNIYPGEDPPAAWNLQKNNIGKLYNYLVTISPPVNFVSSEATTIVYDGRDYVFEGFSILSDQPLDKLPFCDLIRFHIRYTIYLIEEPVPENFCMKGLQLFSDYFFRDILELYDWIEIDGSWPKDTDSEIYRKFHFFPRFVRPLPDNGKEILSMCEVLKYLLKCNKPLVSHDDLAFLMNCDHRQWLNYTGEVRGMVVTCPGWKPSSLRVDQLDRYERTSVENPNANRREADNHDYPMIVHFGIRPANLSYAGDPQYQRVWRSYLKLRHLMANSPTVKQSDKAKLKQREEALQEMRRAKVMQREVTVELSSKGFIRTGIFSDMCQHALLLPVLTHHLRYQLCLTTLEVQIGYQFRERKWLSHAMNHPSCQMNFGANSDHVRNALSNCGLRQPKYGDSSIHYKYTRKRGITTLIRIMARLGQKRPVLSPIEHNERLEFLGDAVVGYLTSIHLFFMFPELSEGALTTFRTAIVNNQHLAQLAERMHLDDYMLYAHGPDLCRNADLRHAMANCFEALMGAIYMEAGLEKAKELFTRFLWADKHLQDTWFNIPLHPLQEEEPDTDRQYIESVPILKQLSKLEDDIGVKFNHIRVLAKAFTWRNVHENVLTHGHNQRLEFLGDSICNLVTSTYLFELYPTHHEGHLTLLRATMVNGRTQSLVATELGMPKYVITNMSNDNLGKTEKPRGPDWREKNLADLLEAFVAALYIDKGLEFVKGFMQVCFFPRLKEFIITQEWNDPKSCLQQCCLTLRQEGKEPQLPTYKIENKSGPSHARKYKVTVYFQGSPIGYGQGGSIQEAERNAAKKALEEYNFPQLEWQRRYVAKKHNVPYKPGRSSKKHFKEGRDSDEPRGKRRKFSKDERR